MARPFHSVRSATLTVALSALTLFVMAVVAAGRGSPYQPVLTPNGRSRGWLRELAAGAGLERLTGNPLLAVGVLAAVAAVAAFLLLLRESWRGHVPVTAVVLVVVGAHVLLLFLPLLFSRDVYSYAYYGRIAVIYDGNPYVETPLDHPDDLLWRYVGPKWVDTPAVYGPAWTALSAGLAEVLPRPVDHVLAYRWLAVGASLGTCVAIAVVARRLRPDRTAFALAAFGANPVVLFHSVASGHNDLLVALAVIVALGFVVWRHPLAAVVVLALGTLVKATAALPLLLLLVWIVASCPPEARRRALATHVGAVLVVGLAFAVPYLQLRDPSLGMLQLATHEGWLAPSAVFGRVLDWLSFGTLGWAVRLVFGLVLLAAVVALAREVWRRSTAGSPLDPSELGAAWGWALVLLALLGPVLLPWYVVWALPVAWLLPRIPRTTLLATSALLAVTLWSAEPLRFPGAFDLNLFVGRWIVTPILLLLALGVLRDLRGRLDLGLRLGDDVEPAAAAPTSEEPEGVTEPARQR